MWYPYPVVQEDCVISDAENPHLLRGASRWLSVRVGKTRSFVLKTVFSEDDLKLTDKIFELLEPTVRGLGYELYDVEYEKEYDNWVLTLFIDRPEGVSLDDCELVSNAVDPILDEADPIEQAYYLSVSSVGLDRPLKKDKDFNRNLGGKIDIRLYAPVDGKKELTGTLVSFTADELTVALAKGEKTLARKACALIRPHIDF